MKAKEILTQVFEEFGRKEFKVTLPGINTSVTTGVGRRLRRLGEIEDAFILLWTGGESEGSLSFFLKGVKLFDLTDCYVVVSDNDGKPTYACMDFSHGGAESLRLGTPGSTATLGALKRISELLEQTPSSLMG